ncbi:MAG: ATP-binding protein [Bdellovibrionales bacterium]
MYTRIIKPLKNQSFFLFGPRGTGKTTWLRGHFKNSLYLNLLSADVYQSLLAHPESLETRIPKETTQPIIIDEIQKVPALLDEVHRLIQEKNLSFILTGSSARKLRKSGVNLLAGRARTLSFFPLTTRELGSDFDLRKSLTFGHLPESYTKPDPELFLKSYLQTYLREEVQAEGITRNLANFARFLESASFSQAQFLNISRVAEDCHVDRKMVEAYFNILEDLLIAARVPVFEKRAKRRIVSKPKFFFFDCGVFQSLRPRGPLDSQEEIEGPALETLVWQELRAMNQYLNWGYNIYTWKTQSKAEVDLVLYGQRGLIAIEVKRGSRIRSEDLEGLQLFKKDYPQAKCFLLYLGDKKQIFRDYEAWPAQEFLHNLPL